MAFKFRLEKVHTYRKRIVELLSQEVAEAGRAVAAVTEKIGDLDADIQQFSVSFDRTYGQLQVQTMLAQTNWIEHLKSIRQELELELHEAQEQLAAIHNKLLAAFRDVEVLEKLKQKKRQEWIAEIEHEEQKELDEIGQIRADRQQRSEKILQQTLAV